MTTKFQSFIFEIKEEPPETQDGMEGVKWENVHITSSDEEDEQQQQTPDEDDLEHTPSPEIHADAGIEHEDQELDDWHGLEENADEGYDPVLARTAQLELLHRVQGQQARIDPFHDGNCHRWSDVLTDPDLIPRPAVERRCWEAQ